jgi:hypothetical protein
MTSVYDFQRTLYLAGIGSTITAQLYRAGETITQQMTVEARPAAANAATTY